jgi:hypothetical protein
MSAYVVEAAGGLYAVNMNDDGWYVFLAVLAQVVSKSNGNVSVLLGRHPGLLQQAPPILLASRKETQLNGDGCLKSTQQLERR